MGVHLQRGIVIFLWIILIFSNIPTPLIVEHELHNNKIYSNVEGIPSEVNYTEHDPIIINGNMDFETQLWPGNGSAISPFLINGIIIEPDDDNAISISNTDVYVLINECIIISGEIHIEKSSNIILSNNSLSSEYSEYPSLDYGIYAEDSSNLTITNNDVSHCAISGAHLKSSNNCILRHNSFHAIGYVFALPCSCIPPRYEYIYFGDAIWIQNSINCSIIGNWIESIGSTILLQDSHYCSIVNNTAQLAEAHFIRSNHLSIFDNIFLDEMILTDCRCATIFNNSLEDGLSIEGGYSFYNHEIKSNFVKGEPLGYFSGLSNIQIQAEEYGQIIVFNCSNSNISRGTFTSTIAAVKLAYSRNCKISNVNIHRGRVVGFILKDSQNCVIEKCSIKVKGRCIEILDTEHCTIRNNQLYESVVGIDLIDSFSTAITGNKLAQISRTAILVTNSQRTTIHDNEIHDCSYPEYTQYTDFTVYYNSVWIWNSQYCNISGNLIINNTGRGLVLYSCSHCVILRNTYSGNTQGNAYDISGVNNTWDITPFSQYTSGPFDENQNQNYITVAVFSICGFVAVVITIIIFRRRRQ